MVMSTPGAGSAVRVAAAIDFVHQLCALQPRYLQANPMLPARLEQLKGLDPAYLAHEYFNSNWQPTTFSEVAAQLGEAKLDYAAPAHWADFLDLLNLTPAQQQFLVAIADRDFRETTRDVLTNRQFRTDYWIKGARRLTPLQQAGALRQLRVMLVAPRSAVSTTATGMLGVAELGTAVYGPLLDALGERRIHTLGALETALRPHGIELAALLQTVTILIGKGEACLVQPEADSAAARPRTQALNRHLLERAGYAVQQAILASPVSGGGVVLPHLQQLFLLAYLNGQRTPAAWAAAAWPTLRALGQAMLRDGAPLATAAENLAELGRAAELFGHEVLPLMQALGIAAAAGD
jgi:hypothetical protein